MKKNNIKPVAAAVGSTLALALSATVNAQENPFQLVEFGEGVAVAGEAMDMQGNKVMINDETGFTYGGDQKAEYAGGKLATGKKDPAVCGTFGESTCSMPHIKK
ncbi:MAG: hypothetical protein AAF384_19385 [Pseudomonadota bacterium]